VLRKIMTVAAILLLAGVVAEDDAIAHGGAGGFHGAFGLHGFGDHANMWGHRLGMHDRGMHDRDGSRGFANHGGNWSGHSANQPFWHGPPGHWRLSSGFGGGHTSTSQSMDGMWHR